jgi:hypothetical protein
MHARPLEHARTAPLHPRAQLRGIVDACHLLKSRVHIRPARSRQVRIVFPQALGMALIARVIIFLLRAAHIAVRTAPASQWTGDWGGSDTAAPSLNVRSSLVPRTGLRLTPNAMSPPTTPAKISNNGVAVRRLTGA